MKTLVVYYSHDGSTKLMAEVIAKELHADIEEIHPEKPINASGISIVHWGLHSWLCPPQSKIKPLSKNLADYDRIIIGTPVWAYTFAPPIKTLVKEYKISGKQIFWNRLSMKHKKINVKPKNGQLHCKNI